MIEAGFIPGDLLLSTRIFRLFLQPRILYAISPPKHV